MIRAPKIEASYNKMVGKASPIWLITSGGVSTAATTKTPTMA